LITAEFNYGCGKALKSFSFYGHDRSEVSGKNIICAAASALALNFSQSVLKLLRLKMSGVIEKGRIELELTAEPHGEAVYGLNLLTESLKLGFVSINEKYGEAIKIIENHIKD